MQGRIKVYVCLKIMKLPKIISVRAFANFNLSLRRTGVRCPVWVRKNNKLMGQIYKIYKKSAKKNYYKSHANGFYHVDHIIPLHGENVSGLHVPWNLKVIPAILNMAKGTLIVDEWLLRCCGGKEPDLHKPNCKYYKAHVSPLKTITYKN